MTFSPENIRAFFDAHWTVRKYKDVAMPAEHLDLILHAAQRAPTDATAQMYSFIRLTDKTLRTEIAKLSNNPHVATASESFLICADVHRLNEILKLHSFEPGTYPHIAIHFAIGDAVMAAQNMLVAAEMLGYRGCWIGGVLSGLDEICKLTRLPKGAFPFALMTIGVPDEQPHHRPRIPRALVVHENHYQAFSPEKLQSGIDAMAPITARGNWADTLNRYFGKGSTMEAREPVLKAYLKRAIFD